MSYSIQELLRVRSWRAVCAAVLEADACDLGATRGASFEEPGGSEFSVVCLDEVVALRSHLPERAEIFVVRSPPVGTDLLKA